MAYPACPERPRDGGKRWYQGVYLRSSYWRYLKQRALARAFHRCEACKMTHELHIHHEHYKAVGMGDVELASVRVLCRSCHERAHNTTFEPAKRRRRTKRRPRKNREFNARARGGERC